MSLHSRPLPRPATPAGVALDHVTPDAVTREARQDAPPASDAPPSTTSEPRRAADARAERRVPAESARRPWYRSEPWLATMLAGFIPMLAAILAPPPAKPFLIAASALLAVVGIVQLVRGGLYEPPSHLLPDAPAEDARGAERAHEAAASPVRDAEGGAGEGPTGEQPGQLAR